MTLHASTDLSDAFPDRARSLALDWRDFGGATHAVGRAATLMVFEDNAQVRRRLEQAGDGRVLVIDGGGSMRTALLGGNLAGLAASKGWAGVVVHGAVRDREECAAEAVLIKALGSTPRKSAKHGAGVEDTPLLIGGAIVRPGDVVIADPDGVLVLPSDDDILAALG